MPKRKVPKIEIRNDPKASDELLQMTQRALNDQRYCLSLPPLPSEIDEESEIKLLGE